MGCFPLYQNFRKFRSKNKWDALICVEISGQNGPPPEVVLFDGWSGLTETSRSISKNFRFQSYLAKQQSKFQLKRKWIVSMRLKTLFQ